MILSFLLLTVSFLILAFFLNQKRAKKELQFELVPNCLLTRYPLLFISGYQSPFYFSKYWNEFPAYLSAHGYEVFNFNLSWHKDRSRKMELVAAIKNMAEEQQRFHLILSPETALLLQEICSELGGSLVCQVFASVTVCADDGKDLSLTGTSLRSLPVAFESLQFPRARSSSFSTRLLWNIHQMWTQAPRYELSSVGGDLNLRNCMVLLERAKLLAERDLIKST